MKVHSLKIWPEFFQSLKTGKKTWEVRKNDRNFEVGDHLLLREWDTEIGTYTGPFAARVITYVCDLTAVGVEGFVGMSLRELNSVQDVEAV